MVPLESFGLHEGGDTDNDADADLTDLAILLSAYGTMCPELAGKDTHSARRCGKPLGWPHRLETRWKRAASDRAAGTSSSDNRGCQ